MHVLQLIRTHEDGLELLRSASKLKAHSLSKLPVPPSRLVLSNSSSGVHKASRTLPLQEWVRLEKLDADELAVHPRYPIQPTSQQAAAVVTTAPAPRTPFVPPQQVIPQRAPGMFTEMLMLMYWQTCLHSVVMQTAEPGCAQRCCPAGVSSCSLAVFAPAEQLFISEEPKQTTCLSAGTVHTGVDISA